MFYSATFAGHYTSACKKFDGKEMRFLAPGEYTQMSGRAGRRGKDDSGLCIIMVDEKMEKDSLLGMCMGQPQPLNSEFKLSYYSILNLLKRASGTVNAEYVIARSFHQFQHTRAVPIKQARLTEIEAERSDLMVANETAVREYSELRASIAECEKEMLPHIVNPGVSLPFLKAGRMIRVRDGDADWGWGVVVNVVKVDGAEDGNVSSFVVDTLLQCAPGAAEGRLVPAPRDKKRGTGALAEEGCTTEVIPVSLNLVAAVSAIRLTLPGDLRQRNARESVGLALNELHQRFANQAFPRIDPVKDMKIDNPGFLDAVARCEKLERKLKKHPMFKADSKAGEAERLALAQFEKKAKLDEEAAQLRMEIKSTELSKFRHELASRAR